MMLSRRLLFIGIAIATASIAVSQPANAQLLGPSPYLSSADSPFAGLSITPGGYFFLEDFEDHLVNTPGITSNGTVATVAGFSGSIIDSVDADDGAINGTNGNGAVFGDSLFSGAGNITVTFNAGTLGAFPTHAGFVWTDGAGSITFEAFDALGVSLGTVIGNHADGDFGGGTAEDRFYGVTNAGGISSITISNPAGIEVDHVQYGTLQAVTVPEAGTLPLLGSAFALCTGAFVVRRRKSA